MIDFLAYKVFLRSVLSSFAPIASYSLGYLVYWLAKLKDAKEVKLSYLDPRVWWAILGLSIIYPLN